MPLDEHRMLDAPLNLSYAMQYAHNIKDHDNNLIISLQRPKR
jgi:hypothetical protein